MRRTTKLNMLDRLDANADVDSGCVALECGHLLAELPTDHMHRY